MISMQATLQAATKTANTHDTAGLKQRRSELAMRKRPRSRSMQCFNSALHNSHRLELAADANEDNGGGSAGEGKVEEAAARGDGIFCKIR